jgi:large subunit ribosomal protein L10
VLTREEKQQAVAELSEKFSRASGVYVADYCGLSVEDVHELRCKLRETGEEGECDYQVAKNSLLRLAVEGSDAAILKEHFTGPTSIAISYGDPVAVAKVLFNYAKEHEIFEIKGAVLDGKALDEADMARLATLPNLQELRGKLVGLLMAPAGKIARLVKEPGGQLARLVAARKDSLEE